jgi:hypothetical protein
MYRNRPLPSSNGAASSGSNSSNSNSSGAPNPGASGKAGGGGQSRHANNNHKDGGVVLCLTRFRIVPVPATHTVFLAVQVCVYTWEAHC